MAGRKLESRIERDPDKDRTIAVFYDESGCRVELSLPTKWLDEIGNPPERLQEKEANALEVFRAMLELVEERIKPGELVKVDERDIGKAAIRKQFASGPTHIPLSRL